MTKRTLSYNSLKARIETLRRRHRELDQRIALVERQPAADTQSIKQLKKERLGLRDTIRITQSVLSRLNPHPNRLTWHGHFHSG